MSTGRLQLLIVFEHLQEAFERLKVLEDSGAWPNETAAHEALRAVRLAKTLVIREYLRQRDGEYPPVGEEEKIICV